MDSSLEKELESGGDQSLASLAGWMASVAVGDSVLYVDCRTSDVSLALAREGYQVKAIHSSTDGLEGMADVLRREHAEVASRVQWETTGLWDLEPLVTYDTLIVGGLDSQSNLSRHLVRASGFLAPSGRMVFGAKLAAGKDSKVQTLPRTIIESLGDSFDISCFDVVDGCLRLLADRAERGSSKKSDSGILHGYEQGLEYLESIIFRHRQLLEEQKSQIERYEFELAAQSSTSRDLQKALVRSEALTDAREKLAPELERTLSKVDHLIGIEKYLKLLAEGSDRERQAATMLQEKLSEERKATAALRMKVELLEESLQETDDRREEHWNNFKSEKTKRVALESMVHEMRKKIEIYEGSTALAIGRALVQARSVKGLVRLPKEMWRGLRMRQQRQQQTRAEVRPEKKATLVQSASVVIGNAATAPLDVIGWSDEVVAKRPTVLSILDEFTQSCFRPHANLIEPRPDNWRSLMDRYSPDYVIVESAWRGNLGGWQFRIADYEDPPGRELEELVAEARSRGIATLFWNKEDPVHFDNFIASAGLFDVVLTTAQETVELYEQRTNARVGVLPFAAEGLIHNPIGSGNRNDKVCFAGSYYVNRFQDRAEEMANLMEAATRFPLDIFDRNHGAGNPDFMFPRRFEGHIRGRLGYEEMNRAYKQYKVFLNVNSVSDSKTMFSRRVFELLACGTPIVSTPSRGIEEFFGTELVWLVETKQEAENAIRTLLNEPDEWRRRSIEGIRSVFRSHTYAHRLRTALSFVNGSHAEFREPGVLVVANVSSQCEVDSVVKSFSRQTVSKSERKLYLVSGETDLQVPEGVDVLMDGEVSERLTAVAERHPDYQRLCIFDPNAAYGKHYLEDLRHALTYSEAELATKATGSQDEYAFVAGYIPTAAMYALDRCSNFGTSVAELVAGGSADSLVEVGGRIYASDCAELKLDASAATIEHDDSVFSGIEIT